MKLVKPSVELIEQENGLEGIYKQIELGGRIAYKSEHNIGKEPAKKFVDRIVNLKHNSVLEHGTVYLTHSIPIDEYKDMEGFHLDKYYTNPYSDVNVVLDSDEFTYYITTNYRVIIENNWDYDFKYLTDKSMLHSARMSLKIVCDRAVSHQLVRHRNMSFTQESQRYCNYSKDRFSNNVQFVIPSEYRYMEEGDYVSTSGTYSLLSNSSKTSYDLSSIEGMFLHSCAMSEIMYLDNIGSGNTPQLARKSLINATKTELFITGFSIDWLQFLELRLSRNSDPDMQEIAKMIEYQLCLNK